MDFQAWLSIATVLSCMFFLARTKKNPDLILMGGLVFLLTMQIITPAEAFVGFSNSGVITVGVLFVVSIGIRETGAFAALAERALGHPKSIRVAQLRLMLPVALISGFINNTPLVAALLPTVDGWAKRNNFSVSKLLIPLSYATIMGGTCTLIGTSTNLVVYGLMEQRTEPITIGFFELGYVGLPCALMGIGFILLTQHWLLKDRKPAISIQDNPREYTVEMLVDPNGPLIDQSIQKAGLRQLIGLYLMEIERNGEILPAVSARERLRANDRLVFVGLIESVVELQKIRGLLPATNQVFKLDARRNERSLIEAVVADACPVVGHTIREGQFRKQYNAVVIAVARNGERINKKIGDIVLNPGDTLLVEAHPSFVEQNRNSKHFFLVSEVENSTPPNHGKAHLAICCFLVMVVSAATGLLPMLTAALLTAFTMLLLRCLTFDQARKSIDWSLLLVIASSFGLGNALLKTGAATSIAGFVLSIVGDNPWLVLVAIYFLTNLFTEFITNNAAAVLIYPIAISAAESMQVSLVPFAITIMIAASKSFATPIGYQTNLMVYGPGGYKFSDYLRIGVPLNLGIGALAVILIPLIWPF